MSKVYIACPMNVSMGHLEGVVKALTDEGFAVNYWKRGTPYTDDGVRYCDIFVVIINFMHFKCYVNQLPVGTRKELKLAYNEDKPIYVGYRTQDDIYRIYDCIYDEDNSSIQAIAGTAGNICKDFPQLKPSKKAPTYLEHPVDSNWPKVCPPSDFDNEGMPIFPAQKIKARIAELESEYDERLLLFYKH